jgi:hypothetical protein
VHPVFSGDRPLSFDGEHLVHDDAGAGRCRAMVGLGPGMACEVYVSAPPASSATVTAGQRAQVKVPGQRTREVTLDTGASTDTPARTKGQARACPDRTQAIPYKVRDNRTGRSAECNLGCSSPQYGSVHGRPTGRGNPA